MKSTTLIESGDSKLVVRGYDLGQKISSNLVRVFTLEELEYWEKHLAEIPAGLARFANRLPENIREQKAVEAITGFKIGETDLFIQLAEAEAFAKKYFGLNVMLAGIFELPETVPWESVLPVFVPVGTDNRNVCELLKKLGLNTLEEVDVMKCANSEASDKHQLFLINNSERPDKDTMGLSPNRLRKTKKPFLNLRGYGLAMAFYHKTTEWYLDPKTITWFPKDRLPDGRVACGDWYLGYCRARFSWSDPGYERGSRGARLAIQVPLKAKV
jgi:hypothetical protein